MRPAGRKRKSASASANARAHSWRFSGASASAAARATRAQVSSRVRSRGVPSGALKRYFLSQIWWESAGMRFSSYPRSSDARVTSEGLMFALCSRLSTVPARVALDPAFGQKPFCPLFHTRLKQRHKFAARQPVRYRFEIFEHDGTGPPDEPALPEEAGIVCHGHT